MGGRSLAGDRPRFHQHYRHAALDDCDVTHQFQRILKTAGLPRLRFHDLRHTCAALLIAQGVHPRYVMDILGHSQIALTMANSAGYGVPSPVRAWATRSTLGSGDRRLAAYQVEDLVAAA